VVETMKEREISLPGRQIGTRHPPFVIAEMSGNHNQSLERALALVEAAAAAGAHALKLQTYTADTMTINLDVGEFRIDDQGSLWAGRSLYDLYQEAHTPWQWHKPIFDRARDLGLIAFSTPFDASAVDFLESLNVPCYKIASFENTDLPLIRHVARTGKPVIVSTGMASEQEIADAVTAIRSENNDSIILLRCVSAYPASPAEANLLTIPDMRSRFGCQVGLSDHTMGVGVAAASVAFGATVIEKHFTLRRADGGVDSAFSLEPDELKALVVESERAWLARGEVQYGAATSEQASLQFRRSLYAVADIKAGEVFSTTNVRAIRPGLGLAPKHIDAVLGRRARVDVTRGTPLNWDLFA
jgi:N-acetylneuraminate synthase